MSNSNLSSPVTNVNPPSRLRMSTGFLWFCDDPKQTFAEKVGRAAERFRVKYGTTPNLVYCHPATGQGQRLDFIETKESRSIQPNHFWLGIV